MSNPASEKHQTRASSRVVQNTSYYSSVCGQGTHDYSAPYLRLCTMVRHSQDVDSSQFLVYIGRRTTIATVYLYCSLVPFYNPPKVSKSRYTPYMRLGERRYSSYSFLTSALERGEWSASHPGRDLPPGERAAPYPLYRRLGGPQSRSGRRG
jgi:hypothetical protein